MVLNTADSAVGADGAPDCSAVGPDSGKTAGGLLPVGPLEGEYCLAVEQFSWLTSVSHISSFLWALLGHPGFSLLGVEWLEAWDDSHQAFLTLNP